MTISEIYEILKEKYKIRKIRTIYGYYILDLRHKGIRVLLSLDKYENLKFKNLVPVWWHLIIILVLIFSLLAVGKVVTASITTIAIASIFLWISVYYLYFLMFSKKIKSTKNTILQSLKM